MKYFFDTEFIESGSENPIQLVSIGIFSEENDEYYAISNNYDESMASDWVKQNVLKKLNKKNENVKSLDQILKDIVNFVGDDPAPQFIANYGAYDWVVFCQIFGTMMNLPKNFPMWYIDIQQIKHDLRVAELPKQTSGEHNALEDAKYNKKCYEYLMKIKYQGKKPFNLSKFRELLMNR